MIRNTSVSAGADEDAAYILVAADLFESAVLVDEWSAVLLPLGGQVHHSIGAGLHQRLEEQTSTHTFPLRPAGFDKRPPAGGRLT